MDRLTKKKFRRQRIKRGIRKKILGTPERPRLSVYRSNNEIYGQIIDDKNGNTLAAVSSLALGLDKKLTKTERSAETGKELARKAKDANVETVVFDRNGFLYHGRVKAFADGVREGGLKF